MTSGPETSTELQRASPESKALVIGVERAYVALRDARNDFERMIVRGKAQAIAAAAAVLKRRDIQTEASMLVSSAEREIAKANPPQQGRRRDLEDNEVDETGDDFYSPEVEVDQRLVQNIRAAHDKLTDEQFEAVAEEARKNGEPLTRTALKREARKLNPPAQDDSDESEPDKPKPPTKVELLEAERDALRLDAQEKARRIEELAREVQFLRDQSSPVEAVRERTLNSMGEEIRILEAARNRYMNESSANLRSSQYWEREAKKPCSSCGAIWERRT